MAVAKFKQQQFSSAVELEKFVVNTVAVSSVVSVVFDAANNRFVLFYLTP